MQEVDLSKYDNSWYQPGGKLKRILWYVFNVMFLLNPMNPFNGLRKFILRLFGAKIAEGVVIKPRVNIKYPWNLEIGAHTWVGEKVWIDNLGTVTIGPNVCLSQGAMLLSGNHNYKKVGFDLMVEPITLEAGVWIGAWAIVCPGTVCKTHAVLTVKSVASGSLEAYGIYTGNPARLVKKREIEA